METNAMGYQVRSPSSEPETKQKKPVKEKRVLENKATKR